MFWDLPIFLFYLGLAVGFLSLATFYICLLALIKFCLWLTVGSLEPLGRSCCWNVIESFFIGDISLVIVVSKIDWKSSRAETIACLWPDCPDSKFDDDWPIKSAKFSI